MYKNNRFQFIKNLKKDYIVKLLKYKIINFQKKKMKASI